MKMHGILVCLLLGSIVQGSAQFAVEVSLEQQQYLPGESIIVAVRITNRSGRAVRLGVDRDWLSFTVAQGEGQTLPPVIQVPVVGEFTLESSEIATKRVDLMPCYAFDSGRFQVCATVHIPSWEASISSDPKSFEVVPGSRLWDQEFGVPAAPNDTNSVPELRKYVLKQIHYVPGKLRLYLSVEDMAGRPIKVCPIGAVLSFSRNDPRVDAASNMHLLYQSGPRSFSYTSYDPNGNLLARQLYDYADSRPRLAVDESGQVFVAGGIPRYTAGDFPRPKFLVPPPPGVSNPPVSIPNITNQPRTL
jgi:hypothetical protein